MHSSLLTNQLIDQLLFRDEQKDEEIRDLLCNLLTDTLYKYSYNDKYFYLIRVGSIHSFASLSFTNHHL